MRRVKARAALCLLLACALLLGAPCARAEYRELREGMRGSDVLALKTAMYYLGYFTSLNLSDSYNAVMTQRVKNLQKANDLPQTGQADAALQALVFSGQCVPAPGAPDPTAVPTPSPAPTPVPTPIGPQAQPALPQLTEDGLLPAGTEPYVYADADDGLWIYKSDVLSVEIRRYTDTLNTLVWFETDVRCTPGAPLTSYLSAGKTPGRRGVNPIDLARDNHVVLGITDDFFGTRRNNNETVGIVIRNGKIISDKTYKANRARFPNLEVLAVFNDGSMKACLSDAHTAQEYLDMGATDVFAFGPILVSDGQPGAHMGDDTYYHYREPRCALGMIAPYHYIILTVKGRVKESKGVYFDWLADKMLEKGAVEALNLDGGGTVALVFMGEILNKMGKTMRDITSIIGFGQHE